MYGLYISSTSFNVFAFNILSNNSGVIFHNSIIQFIAVCFALYIFSVLSLNSIIALICSSSKLPVLSFLYLAINGTVDHSAVKSKTTST
ncbi:MAG: hypothetical protein Q8S84_05870 [bacterium]|nr:hypothetical protein [bacterium]MDP3381007.1 hypothetical protein [bacterium]